MAKLPISKKITYGIGQLSYNTPAFFLSAYIYIFYSPLQGRVFLSAYLVGVSVFVGTLIQALANPFIGNWSDKSTYKVGRRRFFLLTGFIPLSVFFALIWAPFTTGIRLAILLTFYLLAYNFLFAYVVLPYLSLVPELTTDSQDRVILTTISAYFGIFGIILASVLPLILFILKFSYTVVGTIIAVIMLLSLLTVIVSVKEKPTGQIVPKKYSVGAAFVQTFKNKTFDRYIVAYLFFQFGFYFFLSSLGYFVERIVLPGNPSYNSYVGLFTLIAVLSTIIFSPLLVRYSKKNGEKKAFILFTGLLGLAMLLTFFIGFVHIISNMLQMTLLMVFAGLGLTSYFILPNAIISEIIDEDETLSGFRREGMYFGVQGLLERIPSGLSGFVLGIWVTYLYEPTGNPIFIRALALIGGAFTVITAITFFFVPLKQGIKTKGVSEIESDR
ncbi:MAG: MFS transporter [Candidatus Thermoplasmatota archaeon]|jgi:GPH family glycoside/pentoside/hexuronide:cation symporter|nr:MFS transporter [Candidatus Thermoplasmatota archaeon]